MLEVAIEKSGRAQADCARANAMRMNFGVGGPDHFIHAEF